MRDIWSWFITIYCVLLKCFDTSALDSFFFFIIILLLYWEYTVIVTKFLKYNTVEFTPSIILLYPSFPIPGIVSTTLIFPFSYIHIHASTPFPYILPTPTGTNPPDKTCFSFLFSVFGKQDIFVCLT
jgi:hypothetical protein